MGAFGEVSEIAFASHESPASEREKPREAARLTGETGPGTGTSGGFKDSASPGWLLSGKGFSCGESGLNPLGVIMSDRSSCSRHQHRDGSFCQTVSGAAAR